MNSVSLVGNLTRDPELRKTNSGLATCSFTVAVNRQRNKDGVQQADYIPVVTWRATAENCAKYLAKGRKVAVKGEIRTRNYDDKNGVKRYVTEVIANEVEFLTRAGRTMRLHQNQVIHRRSRSLTKMDSPLLMTTICRSKLNGLVAP